MKKTHKTKSITCRIVSTGTVMQVNTIDEILSPGHYKIDACGVTASDGFPDGVEGECLSAYLEVSDTNHSADNLKSAAVGQTLTYTDTDGSTAVYHRSGTNKNSGKVEWSAWSDTAAVGLQNGSITSEKLSKDVRTKINSPLRPLFIAAGAEYNDTDKVIEKIAPWVDDNGNNYIVKHLPGCYFYNFIGDLTEEDMLYIIENDEIVYNLGRPRLRQGDGRLKTFKGVYHEQSVNSLNTNSYSQFLGCVNLEVAMFSRYVYIEELAICRLVCGTSHFFSGCSKLKFVSPMNLDNISGYTNVFQNCSSLIEVKLYGLKTNFTLESSPLINKRSILCLIQNANPSSAITIKLHSDAYARLADDADVLSALADKEYITLVS